MNYVESKAQLQVTATFHRDDLDANTIERFRRSYLILLTKKSHE